MPKAYSQMPRAMGVTEGQTGGGKVSGGTLGELKSGLGSKIPDWGAKVRTGWYFRCSIYVCMTGASYIYYTNIDLCVTHE